MYSIRQRERNHKEIPNENYNDRQSERIQNIGDESRLMWIIHWLFILFKKIFLFTVKSIRIIFYLILAIIV